jgi:LytS/YehU family sensor histidine kinase
MLGLRLELERQRLASIQAQLEPHFLFNALNAISALVRTEERATALNAITRLSGLLRYTLTASRVDTVTLREELDFVRDYIELQRLRYGARLVVRMPSVDASLLELTCPPLLLQPLVENALRHDLDTHDGPSDLQILVARNGEGARITIANPLRDEPSPNAGFGLGLESTRERLALRYGDGASLTTAREEGRFVVQLLLPEAVDG